MKNVITRLGRRGMIPAERRDDPLAHGARVEHRLGGGERLGHHDHEGGLGVQAVEGARHVHGVDVGEEAKLATASSLRRLGAGAKGGVHEQGSEERTSDAHRHHARQGLSRRAQPFARGRRGDAGRAVTLQHI